MTATYDCIATTTLGSAQSSVTFSSISSGFTDLVLVSQLQTTGLVENYVKLNGDTGSNYSITRLIGSGSNPSSDRFSNQNGMDFAYSATSGWLISTIHFMNYSNATTYKTVIGRWNSEGNSNYTVAWTGLWRNTSAINQITLQPNTVNFSSGSTFTLYGIKSE